MGVYVGVGFVMVFVFLFSCYFIESRSFWKYVLGMSSGRYLEVS